jgi:glycerol uptake facilitator protein
VRPYLTEFDGSTSLFFLGSDVVANVMLSKSKAQSGGWIVVAAGWACAVALAVYAIGLFSGAHINPSVTVCLASVGAFDWHPVPKSVLLQLAGAFLGSALVFLAHFTHWRATSNPAGNLPCYCTSPAIRRLGSALMPELIGTAALLLVVLALGQVSAGAATGQEAWAAAVGMWIRPALVGLLVFAIGLSLGGPTGYTINPARNWAVDTTSTPARSAAVLAPLRNGWERAKGWERPASATSDQSLWNVHSHSTVCDQRRICSTC